MTRKAVRLLIVLCILAMSATVGFGQGTNPTGSLSGTVTDPHGAVVAGATVVVKNTATGQEFTTQTSGEGTFSTPSLRTGDYTATITAPGFKQALVTKIKVIIGTPSSITVSLEVGAASETVTVVGGGELLQTQSATVGTSISGPQITELPYASRNALDLLLFLPGTNTAGRPRQSTVNGLPKAMLNITLDGLNIQDNLLRGSDGFFTLIQPKTDAVQEVTISTSTPGAESNAGGAVQIKFTTRSGSNDYHGSLYWEHRDKSLNGNFFWNNMTLAPKPHFGQPASPNDKAPRTPILLNQPGGRIGGPIRIPYLFNGKDKAFFFVNYEEYRLPEATLRSRIVLSQKALSGLFSIAGPGSATVNLYALAAAAGFTSTPDPTIGALLASTRSAQGTYTPNASDGNVETLTFTNSGGQVRKFPTVRFDFEVSKKNHVEVIWNYQQFRSKVDFLNNADPFAPGFPNFGSQDSNRFSFVTAWRSQLTSSIVNEARYGVQNGVVLFFPQVNGAQFVNQGGFAQGISVAASTISNVTTNNAPQRRNTPTTSFSDNVSYVRGKHTFNFGVNFNSIATFLVNATNGAVPTTSYARDTGESTAFTDMFLAVSANATLQNQANTLYRVLVGRLTQITHAAALNEGGTAYSLDANVIRRYRQRSIGIYGQDSWRVKSNLTVNYGLRLENVYAPISENKALTQNTFAGLFGTSGTDLSALFRPGATGGSATAFTPLPEGQHLYETRHPLAPTIGFAYQPDFKHGFLRTLTGSAGKTVLRGGWSMAFGAGGLNLPDSIVGANFGGTRTLTQIAGSPTGFPRGTLFRALPPAPTVPGAPVYPLIPGLFDQAAANSYSPNLKTPYVLSFSGSIQRELSKDMVLEIGYVGNRGHQLPRQFNVNEVNTVENGFANEFRLAAANLAANVAAGRGANFRYFGAGTGTFPLPIFLGYLAGLSGAAVNVPGNYNLPGNLFANTSFTNLMTPTNYNAITAGGILNNPNNLLTGNAAAAGFPANLFVVNPIMTVAGSFLVNNDGKTWYDAMTIQLRRRMSKGVLADFSYTFSKGLGNQYVSSAIAFAQPATLRNTWLNKVASPFDINQSLKGSFIADMPVGRGKQFLGSSHGIVNGLLGDWTLNGTLRVSSGVPMNLGNVQIVGMTRKELEKAINVRKTTTSTTNAAGVTTYTAAVFWLPQDIIDNTRRAFATCIPNTTNCNAFGYSTALLAGGPTGSIAGGSPNGRYLAPAGLNCLQSFTGQCGFTQLILHGPEFARLDIGIEKKFKFSETKNLEFRFEFLNALNNINFRLGTYQADTYTIGGAQSGTIPVPTFTDARFGQLTSPETAYRDTSTTNDPGGRVGQIVIRFNF